MLAALVIALIVQDAPVAEGPPPPTALPSRITEVVVHRTLARVTRSAEVPGDGRYLVEGLPGLVNPESVRVRLSAGSVASVEVHKRESWPVPVERIAELRADYESVLVEKRVLTDEQGLRTSTRDHFAKLMSVEQKEHLEEMSRSRPNASAWQENLTYLLTGIETAQGQLRDVEARLKLLDVQLKAAYEELGKAMASKVDLKDVSVDIRAAPGARLDVEYVVSQAGWTPIYELRTSNDATSIDLVYRARLTQMTGEDWNECALVLSTAQPEHGAKGLEPQPTKARLTDMESTAASRAPGSSPTESGETAPFTPPPADVNGITAEKPADHSAVEAQGLSVQFRLPEKETILSRMDPATVLIGERRLATSPEHVVTPAVESTVWVRGRTQNSTPWVMLPGPAAVYFGDDFIGTSRFTEPVMPGQGFTVHLGADPGMSCRRVQTSDVHQEPSFLSRRQVQARGLRISLENNGGHPCREDGSVDVIVRQAIPVPADERIQVEVAAESRPASNDERWQKDQAELGIRTWVVNVPRGERADLNFEVRTSWPEDLGMRVDSAW